MTREEAIEKLQKQKAEYLEEWVDYSGVAEAFDMAIEALQDRPKGEWIEHTDCEGKTRTITCSKCGWVEHSWVDLNYCPSCGAKMKGGAE